MKQFNTWLQLHLWAVILWVMAGFSLLFLRITVVDTVGIEVVKGFVTLWFMLPAAATLIATRTK